MTENNFFDLGARVRVATKRLKLAEAGTCRQDAGAPGRLRQGTRGDQKAPKGTEITFWPLAPGGTKANRSGTGRAGYVKDRLTTPTKARHEIKSEPMIKSKSKILVYGETSI